ncbi:MAG: cation:proton antiporter [Verrucomicrobia bacterium]|nr:cation:proton antiporter [Verrucomicrobiota bacterium]
MEISLLKDIVIIFGLSMAILLLCHRLKIPSIVGFILTGVLSGPHGLQLVRGVDNVEILSQIGIILLLFTVGMELSIRKILDTKRYFFLGGLIQVALTTLGGYLIAQYVQRPVGESLFLGFLLSLSSTAIVLRILQDRVETGSPYGRIIVAILIFQDILVIPLMLLVPFMAGKMTLSDISLVQIFGALLFIVSAFLAAIYLLPWLLDYIARTKSRELFLLAIFLICFSVAWFAANLGLSLSIGAFLAGLIISETEYSHEAIGDVLPFRDIFTSFFFVSVGMMLDIGFVLSQPFVILGLSALVILFKTVTGGIATLLLGTPLRIAVVSAIALSQIGEFSFVLAKAGIENNIGLQYYYQLFLAVSLFTMAITPFMMLVAPHLANLAMMMPLPTKMKTGLFQLPELVEHQKKDHVVIVGFGISGKNLAGSCRYAGIPYTIIETNPDTVHSERKRGEPIHFGDASHEAVLNHAHIKQAKVLAVLVNDSHAALRIVKNARKLNPNLFIISRTRYVQDVALFSKGGSDDIIPDEFGASIEIFTRVLRKFNISTEEIDTYTSRLSNTQFLK